MTHKDSIENELLKSPVEIDRVECRRCHEPINIAYLNHNYQRFYLDYKHETIKALAETIERQQQIIKLLLESNIRQLEKR